jgi:hypothetical protein
MKRLSIVIVTYKSEEDIYDCLQSIWQYNDIPNEDLEVIVVDNSPESEMMFLKLRELYKNDIVLIHNTHNGGYGQGNNVGIKQAKAPTIMIMNPDVRLCQPIFRTALEAFAKDETLCMYGMKQMLSSTVKSPLSFDCSRLMNGYIIPFIATLCNKFDLYIPSCMYMAGSCFFINKEKFEGIGLFDEDIFMYGEEDDIHFRLKKRFGSHFAYNPALRYIHQTLERPMSFATEQKMVDSIARLHAKKGYTEKATYQNFARYYRVRLVMTYLKKIRGDAQASKRIFILKEVIQYCSSVKST